MSKRWRLGPAVLAGLAVLMAACAPGAANTGSGERAAAPQGPKILRLGMMGEIKASLVDGFMEQAQIRGRETVTRMLATSLTTTDPQGTEIPLIAEQTPSLESGTWKILPDGTMETTYQLRPGVTWHDGTGVTAADFVLAGRVGIDRSLTIATKPWGRSIESFSAPNPQTLVVRWSATYINANNIFGLAPLPSHLLSEPYAANPSGLFEHPYWTNGFVGTGPFKLDSFESASHITLTAYDGYFLGRARLDRIEAKTFLDANALVANILSGAVEMTLDNSLTVDQAVQVRDLWTDGTMFFRGDSNGVPLWINLQSPDPAAIGTIQFRKAIYHSLDRQTMVETMQHGMSDVVNHYLSKDDPDYEATRAGIVSYDYDPRKTAQMLQSMGFTRGGDGYYRDGAGQPLTSMELRSTATDALQMNVALISAANWESVGLKAAAYPAPEQLRQDREWRISFPAFEVSRKGQTVLDMAQQFHSRELPTAANNWSGNNRSRLVDPQLDSLADRYLVTIPLTERRAISSQILHLMTDNVYLMPTFFFQYPIMVSNKLQNIGWKTNERHTTHLWDKVG